MKFIRWFWCRPPETTFYAVTREGTLALDLAGLLASGRMDRQLKAARQMKARKEAA